MFRHVLIFLPFLCLLVAEQVVGQSDFRVPPYVQRPDFDGVSVLWFTESNTPGTFTVSDASGVVAELESSPIQATELAYPIWEINTHLDEFPGGSAPAPPFRHRVRIEGLEWDKRYSYTVSQGNEQFASSFRTAPGILQDIRFAVYGDSETEPESDGARVDWPDALGAFPDRKYLIDQTKGYANNLTILRERDLDFVAIAGDLVQSGGEQRDWDRFWQHNTHLSGDSSLAGQVPVYAVPGNHEYYATPHRGQNEQAAKEYRQPFSEEGMARYRTYFEAPSNGTDDPREGRYYRFDYGPVTVIAVDVCNNGSNQLSDDTNFRLLGEDDPDGGPAPSFTPGSPQYDWLETQLADAQEVSPFTFVLMHYSPYSVGPHGWPAGDGASQDPLSGVPVRALTPLFQKYGVDAVLAGHDEMWERSVVEGTEVLPGGQERDHEIQFYDVGTGGDGLRGSVDGLDNPFQRFFAHSDSPEIWNGSRLIDGGKHYGHLEIDVSRTGPQSWQATLTPVYAFPIFDESGLEYLGFERRVYDDVITLSSSDDLRILASEDDVPDRIAAPYLSPPYPNPAAEGTSVTLTLSEPSDVAITAYDVLGRAVRSLAADGMTPGTHKFHWDGKTTQGESTPAGLYVIRLTTSSGSISRTVTILR